MKKEDIVDIDDNTPEEEMTVELELDDGSVVNCAVITILEVDGKDYIVLLPLDEKGENADGEVWFYRYEENEEDPNEEPVLTYIEDDEEYDAVADAFDEFLDNEFEDPDYMNMLFKFMGDESQLRAFYIQNYAVSS